MVKYIIFRYLTNADFFNIYKQPGTELGGGGQAYIDFPAQDVSLEKWGKFFEDANSIVCDSGEQGPIWYVPLNSIGVQGSQEVKIYQRRAQSICIASQRITSTRENRVKSWHPENGFPEPADPLERNQLPQNLLVYLLRTSNDEFWAGWSLNQVPARDNNAIQLIAEMHNEAMSEGHSGFIEPTDTLLFDSTDKEKPFFTS